MFAERRHHSDSLVILLYYKTCIIQLKFTKHVNEQYQSQRQKQTKADMQISQVKNKVSKESDPHTLERLNEKIKTRMKEP